MVDFLTRDPLSSLPTWVGKHYAYVDATPTVYVDPTGLFGCSVCGKVKNGAKKFVDSSVDKVKDSVQGAWSVAKAAVPIMQQCAIWGAAGAVQAAVLGAGGIVAGAATGCVLAVTSVILESLIGEYYMTMVNCGLGALGGVARLTSAVGGCAAGLASSFLTQTGLSTPGTQCTAVGLISAVFSPGSGNQKGAVGAANCAAAGLSAAVSK